jgi:hypothetical protein
MAAGNYSGTQAERDDYNRLLAVEHRHIAVVPDGEREEIRQIFAAKGFAGDNLQTIVDVITADESRWARTMVVEEYGSRANPEISGIGGALHVCGLHVMRPGPACDLSRGRRAISLHCRNRGDLLFDRRHQKPLVADEVVAVGICDIFYRDARRRAGLWGRLWAPNAI